MMKSKIKIENIKQFVKLELSGWSGFEKFGLFMILILIIFNKLFLNDSSVAIISAFCGISYTILAGKGKISCYLFGLLGTGFYSYLAFKNSLFGNLLLYMGYYIPMQIFGIFKWRHFLDKKTNEIIKTSLRANERIIFITLAIIFSIVIMFILKIFGDSHPILDSLTTVLSIIGMYLTVKRVIEQWMVWMIVNGLSIIIWTKQMLVGEKVYSTILMWSVYLILAIYFYFKWKQELNTKSMT